MGSKGTHLLHLIVAHEARVFERTKHCPGGSVRGTNVTYISVITRLCTVGVTYNSFHMNDRDPRKDENVSFVTQPHHY